MASSAELEATYQAWASSEPGSGREQELTEKLLVLSGEQVRRVVSRVCSSRMMNVRSDIEDSCGNAMLRIYRTLLRWRVASSDKRPPLLKPYVNQVARNVCHDLMREKYPSWFGLAGRLLWRLRHSSRFVVFDSEDCRLCALTETSGRAPRTDRQAAEAAGAVIRQQRDWSRAPLEELLEALLTEIACPVPFETLVDLAMRCTGDDLGMQSMDEEVVPGLPLAEMLSHSGSDPEQDAGDAELLRWLWDEMGELPETQRQVCGLNLEAAVGIRLEVFVLRQAADKERYESLIRALRLRELPGFPPLNDPVIADLLGRDAKQVANARVSAQRRLGRRLQARKESDGSKARVPTSWKETVGNRA